MRVGSLFAGIGGFDLGLERAGFEITWQVEIDVWCRKVLKKHWPGVKRYGDIREVGAYNLEPVDLVCGGFPCQPFSVAGKQRGKEDDRYLWPEMLRVIKELKPRWVVGENVAGLGGMAQLDSLPDLEAEEYATLQEGTTRDTEGPGQLETILASLEEIGYTVQTFIIPACAVNAPHRRDRVWIVAHSESRKDDRRERRKLEKKGGRGKSIDAPINPCRQDVADSEGDSERARLCLRDKAGNGRGQPGNGGGKNASDALNNGSHRAQRNETVQGSNRKDNGVFERDNNWAVEPDVGRVAHGIPSRVDRLKGLGNAVVPQIVEVIGRAIKESE